MPKLRPINETRRANGQLTSETGARLLRSRGGKANVKRHAQAIYQRLPLMCAKSAMIRKAKRLANEQCHHCQHLSAYLLTQIELINAISQQIP